MKTKRKLHNNKKGSVGDILVGLAFLFMAVVLIFVTAKLWIILRGSGLMDNPEIKTKMDDFDTYGTWTWDFMIAMVVVAFFLVPAILAAFARHHPLLAWMNLMLLIILCMLSVPLSNISNTMITDSFSEIGSYVRFSTVLMGHLPTFMIVYSALLALAMFAFKSEVTAI